MGRLINPGIGDIIDRLTILSLKVVATDREAPPHFANERAALLAMLQGRTLNGAWFPHAIDLATVNGQIWHLEDALREIRSHDPNMGLMEEAGRLGCRIQSLNDLRARLIEQINQLTGEHLGPEKV